MSTLIQYKKLGALRKYLDKALGDGRARYYDPPSVLEFFEQYAVIRDFLKTERPELYSDVQVRPLPVASKTSDFEGRGYILAQALERLGAEIDYILELSEHDTGATKGEKTMEKRVFISHGRSSDWRELQAYLERDLKLSTLELAQEVNQGRTVLQKLNEESAKCSYAVIVMTPDDVVTEGAPRARENVMHEIGFFQGRYGLARLAILHEDGTSIPSNIHGLVYIGYPKGEIRATFADLKKELDVAGLKQ